MVRHLIADDKLRPAEWLPTTMLFKFGNTSFARQTLDDLVHQIKGSKFVIANLAAAGEPTVGSLRFADPVCLARSQGVATITDLVPRRTAIRRKALRNNEGVIQGPPLGTPQRAQCGNDYPRR